MRSALGHTVAKDFMQPMPSRISSLVILVLEAANLYLDAAISETMVFTSIHTTKGVCVLGAMGWASKRICADAALVHHNVCKVPGAEDARRLSL